MKSFYYTHVILSMALCLCTVESVGQETEQEAGWMNSSNTDIEESILDFSKSVLQENLRVVVHNRVPSNYWDIQMIFEADDFKSDHFKTYTTYSNLQQFDPSVDGAYDGVILFVAMYKDVPSAQHAFQEIKDRTQIRMEELKGYAGLLVEQVRIFESIRASGGLLTQKDQYVFYLLESCGMPPVGTSWEDYENLFLSYITEENEGIEVVNADCEEDELLVQIRSVQR